MKRNLVVVLCFCLAQLCFAQIRLDTIPNGTRISELVENYFLADNMIPVGINFYGNWLNTRTFHNGAGTIGLDSGIFLSTGNAEEALQHPDSLMNRYLDTLQLDFRVENFEKLVGFQAELKYDTSALEIQ